MMATIDAHHHLWRYRSEEYGWITEEMAGLRRDFLPQDLERLLRAAGVDGTVVVQARQSLEETAWLLGLADECSFLRGVVGWAPIAAPEFPSVLEGLLRHRKLKGLRHVLQGEPDPDFVLGDAFNRGVSLLRETGLVYDILVYERQLPQTIQFVDRHPEQMFVVDHLAKPLIRAGEIEPWATHMRVLARRGHVCCKLSGMVTEADPKQWTTAELKPYWEVVLDAFGAGRILAGSDWPVCELGCSYGEWFDLVRQWTGELSLDEQRAILGGNATRVYRLSP